MTTTRNGRLSRALTLTAALVAVNACSAEVEGPSEADATNAGREYGEALVETMGSRATVEEMQVLCGQGARDGDVVPEGSGDGFGDEIDAFVESCREAVAEQ